MKDESKRSACRPRKRTANSRIDSSFMPSSFLVKNKPSALLRKERIFARFVEQEMRI